jgi:hypothetical protein
VSARSAVTVLLMCKEMLRLLIGRLFHQVDAGLTDLLDHDVLDIQIEFAGLDLREVEDVVNQGQQMPTALFDMMQYIDSTAIRRSPSPHEGGRGWRMGGQATPI